MMFVIFCLVSVVYQLASTTKDRERAWHEQQLAQGAHFSQLIAATELKMKVCLTSQFVQTFEIAQNCLVVRGHIY